MFATLILPFDSYRDLPTPTHRWLMQCLARYTNRAGECWPTMRQLAGDARMSLSTVQRRLAELAELGVFQRTRSGVGRAAPYRLGRKPSVSPSERGVSHVGTQEALPRKQVESSRWRFAKEADLPAPVEWEPRLRGWAQSRFWLPTWGPKPNEPGCWAVFHVKQPGGVSRQGDGTGPPGTLRS